MHHTYKILQIGLWNKAENFFWNCKPRNCSNLMLMEPPQVLLNREEIEIEKFLKKNEEQLKRKKRTGENNFGE